VEKKCRIVSPVFFQVLKNLEDLFEKMHQMKTMLTIDAAKDSSDKV
jgi:hypothetical protein